MSRDRARIERERYQRVRFVLSESMLNTACMPVSDMMLTERKLTGDRGERERIGSNILLECTEDCGAWYEKVRENNLPQTSTQIFWKQVVRCTL